MSKILVIRFSALGDVAMTIPVLYSFAEHFPQHQLVVLSKANMAALFAQAPANIQFRGVDLKNSYKGVSGLNRLFGELKSEGFDAVADLHDVLRTKYLRWRFRLAGTPVAHIDKGRKGKRKLVAAKHKRLERQATSFQRYADVFAQLGYTFPLSFRSIFGEKPQLSPAVRQLAGEKGTCRWIGIAPFAAHRGKIYPSERQEEVIRLLSQQESTRIFLFGGGQKEKEMLETWERKYPRTTSVAGKLKMDDELRLMGWIDVMESMDSGNMHLASLVGTPVVSVWGATHPYAGFLGWGQDERHAIQAELPCRPCSNYGNKPCRLGNYPCLNGIAPETIVNHINDILEQK